MNQFQTMQNLHLWKKNSKKEISFPLYKKSPYSLINHHYIYMCVCLKY